MTIRTSWQTSTRWTRTRVQCSTNESVVCDVDWEAIRMTSRWWAACSGPIWWSRRDSTSWGERRAGRRRERWGTSRWRAETRDGIVRARSTCGIRRACAESERTRREAKSLARLERAWRTDLWRRGRNWCSNSTSSNYSWLMSEGQLSFLQFRKFNF